MVVVSGVLFVGVSMGCSLLCGVVVRCVRLSFSVVGVCLFLLSFSVGVVCGSFCY